MPEPVTQVDWISLGLFLVIVGGFLLASALVLQPPREWVEQALGLAQPGLAQPGPSRPRLGRLREQLFHRVQLAVGFFYILGGFALQLYGRQVPEQAGAREFPALWAGALLLSTLVLLALGWWYSTQAFRQSLAGVIESHGLELHSHSELAREIGLLLGVRPEPQESTEAYARRVQQALGIKSGPAPRPNPRGGEPEEFEDSLS